MEIAVKREEVFIPAWNGNRDVGENEQIRVHHRFLTPSERKKYIYTKPIIIDTQTGTIDSRVEYVTDEQGMVRALVDRIENLKLRYGDEVVEVKTGEELYAQPGVPQLLMAEIEGYIINASPEVDASFLFERSAST